MTLAQYTVSQLLAAFAKKRSTPGGGSAAALAGATAASLLIMAAKISGLREMESILEKLYTTQSRLISLIDEDSEGFSAYIKAQPEEKDNQLRKIILIPVETAELSYSLFDVSAEIINICDPRVVTDIGVGILLAKAGVEGALMNVRINLASVSDSEFKAGIEAKIEQLEGVAAKEQQLLRRIEKIMISQ